jgi:two-component system, cell cycle response regulator CtrA
MADLLDIMQEQLDQLRERVRQLEEALCPPSVVIPVEWRLTGSEARVFAHLTTKDLVTKDSLMAAMYSDRADEEPEKKIVDVFICKLRKKLKPFGIEIDTVWGQGYSLVHRRHFSSRGTA